MLHDESLRTAACYSAARCATARSLTSSAFSVRQLERAVRLQHGLEVRKRQEQRGVYREIASHHHNEKLAVARAWTSYYFGSHLGLAYLRGRGRAQGFNAPRMSVDILNEVLVGDCAPTRGRPSPNPTARASLSLILPLASPFSCDPARIAAGAYDYAPSRIISAHIT